jgi:poly-beta-1,6-N-acetyl-D-glucosamine synthase
MKLCMIIPAFNEETAVHKSILSSCSAGISLADVYVIDDGSKDRTSEVARNIGAQVLTKVNGGKSAALEAGLKHFDLANRYTHVMVLDADSLIDPGYVKAMERAVLRHPNAVLFCGRQCSQRGRWNWLTSFRAVDYAVWCGIYREAQHATGTINVAPGFASMYRMDTFVTLDFHGGTIVEDMDMTIEIQRRGLGIVYEPDALVATQDPENLHDFIGQLMRWYRGTWQVIKKHRLGRHAQRVDAEIALLVTEQMLVGGFIVTLPLWLWLFPHAIVFCLVVDQIIALTYTTLTAIRERRPELLLMFPTFIIPRLLGYFLFGWAYFLERRSKETKWYKVKRY